MARRGRPSRKHAAADSSTMDTSTELHDAEFDTTADIGADDQQDEGDYTEDVVMDDESDVSEKYEEDEEEEERPRKRGRPPGSKNRNKKRRAADDGIDDEDDIDGDTTGGDLSTMDASSAAPKRRGPKGGPRKQGRGGPSHVTAVPLDSEGNPQIVENDEIVLKIDPAGEKKIDSLGNLQGGRDFRVRTFTVTGRGDRLYMLSTEPARCMGFRDSYLLFQKHKKLYKIIVTEEEKFDLINRDIIPHSYKGRAIGIVTARSVFREFGAKIIIGGKRVIDDYYEEEAKEQGFVPGQIADPTDKLPPPGQPYNKNQYVAWHGASAVYHQYQSAVAPIRETMLKESSMLKRKKVVITDENWMYENAAVVSQYNTIIREMRDRTWDGVYEPHTGIVGYPQASQPKQVRVTHEGAEKGSSKDKEVVVSTEITLPNPFTRTGLDKVDVSIFKGTVPPEIEQAILEQQENERKWILSS